MKRVLRVYISSNRDGIMVCPEHPEGRMRGPDSRKRVFLGGPTTVGEMNGLQVRALIDLAFRRRGAHTGADEAVFYDADAWARSACSRRKVVHRVKLP